MRKKLIFITKLLISLGILYYILKITPFSEIAASLSSARLIYIIIGMVLCLLNVYVSAAQMKIITDNQQLSLSINQITSINFITRFYGFFLPGYLSGGAIRWYKLSRPDNKPVEAISSIGFNRLLTMIIVVASGIIFFILDSSAASNLRFIYSLTGILAALLFGYLILNNRKLASFITNHMIKKTESVSLGSFRQKIGAVLNSAVRFHTLSLRSHIHLIGLAVIWRLIGIMSFYLFTCSIEIRISFMSAGWISSVTLIMVMLPISISGLGIREGTLVVLLNLYGVSPHYAVALSFIIFLEHILAAAIGGFCEASTFFLKSRQNNPLKTNRDIPVSPTKI